MITAETIHACEKGQISSLLPTLDGGDIRQLVSWLSEKDDDFRYKCFLLLQARSQQQEDVYTHWDEFAGRLGSDNSYQRSLGLMLIAENARWDRAGTFEAIADRYLSLCDDEKPITVRQCIQGLCKIVPYKQSCHNRIVEKLISIDLMQRKETMRKLILFDILAVLILIQQTQPDERIARYIQTALTGAILDPKTKRQVEAML